MPPPSRRDAPEESHCHGGPYGHWQMNNLLSPMPVLPKTQILCSAGPTTPRQGPVRAWAIDMGANSGESLIRGVSSGKGTVARAPILEMRPLATFPLLGLITRSGVVSQSRILVSFEWIRAGMAGREATWLWPAHTRSPPTEVQPARGGGKNCEEAAMVVPA